MNISEIQDQLARKRDELSERYGVEVDNVSISPTYVAVIIRGSSVKAGTHPNGIDEALEDAVKEYNRWVEKMNRSAKLEPIVLKGINQ